MRPPGIVSVMHCQGSTAAAAVVRSRGRGDLDPFERRLCKSTSRRKPNANSTIVRRESGPLEPASTKVVRREDGSPTTLRSVGAADRILRDHRRPAPPPPPPPPRALPALATSASSRLETARAAFKSNHADTFSDEAGDVEIEETKTKIQVAFHIFSPFLTRLWLSNLRLREGEKNYNSLNLC